MDVWYLNVGDETFSAMFSTYEKAFAAARHFAKSFEYELTMIPTTVGCVRLQFKEVLEDGTIYKNYGSITRYPLDPNYVID